MSDVRHRGLTIREWEALTHAQRQHREKFEADLERVARGDQPIAEPVLARAALSARAERPIQRSLRTTLVAPPKPTPTISTLARLKAMKAKSPEGVALALQWLSEAYPAAFGSNVLPIDPEALKEPYRRAREVGVPKWAWSCIGNRVGNHNGARAVREMSSQENSWWCDLRGKQTRMVTADECRRRR